MTLLQMLLLNLEEAYWDPNSLLPFPTPSHCQHPTSLRGFWLRQAHPPSPDPQSRSPRPLWAHADLASPRTGGLPSGNAPRSLSAAKSPVLSARALQTDRQTGSLFHVSPARGGDVTFALAVVSQVQKETAMVSPLAVNLRMDALPPALLLRM